MLKKEQLRELSFLVYGLGLSGCSVVRFFKKNKIRNFKVWDDKLKNLHKNHRTKNLKINKISIGSIILPRLINEYSNSLKNYLIINLRLTK